MKRKIVLLVISIFIFGCSEQNLNNEKFIKLSNGKSIKINLEIKEIEDQQKGLLIEYKNEEKVIKEQTLENEVSEIWKAVKRDVEKLEVEEGVIKYSYPVGKTKETKETVYDIKLFSVEKIENGTWKIRKVN